MHCPFCGHTETKVIDSRLAGEGRQIRRRRECLTCAERFTTFETAELLLPTVVKGDRSREPFDENKLLHGMQKALEKRPVGRDAIEAAQKADTMCYVILIADRGGWYQGFGEGDMKKLAEETGGRVIEVGNNQQKLRQAFDQIQHELRSQYNIGYTPTNSKLDGSYRKIQIHAKSGDYKVQARQGYYAIARE